MNKQELKQLLKDSEVKGLKIFGNEVYGIPSSTVLGFIDQLDEPEKGYAGQSPQYLKNILARLRELPLHDREFWLKAIMSEFEQDFSRAKWREGYELGKIDGMMECEKVQIPRIVANWIESYKNAQLPLSYAMSNISPEIRQWMDGDCVTKAEIFARAWLDGYEIEKPKYVVTDGNHLYFKKYQEDIEIVILVDEQPGTMTYVKKFDTKEEAQKAADVLGWKVEEVQDD